MTQNPQGQGGEYPDSARYPDDAGRASAGPTGADPSEPTQVVPVQQQPQAPPQPAPPAPADPSAAGDHDPGAYAMAAAAGPEPQPPQPPQPGDEGSSAPRPRRRGLLVWSVVGVVALGGAGLVAANALGGDDSSSSTSVNVGMPSPLPTSPAAPPPPPSVAGSAPPTSASASSASPSATAAASASKSPTATKSPTASPSASPSASGKSPKVDKDNDGITDDPDATDPNALLPAAAAAYAQAKNAMAAEGITMTLTSGKRSYQHQKELWEQEVRDRGSEEAARERVLPPDESSHVDGNAIDINVAAQPWMKANGSRYGWCQIYANESWHFEYDASYKSRGCPALKPHP